MKLNPETLSDQLREVLTDGFEILEIHHSSGKGDRPDVERLYFIYKQRLKRCIQSENEISKNVCEELLRSLEELDPEEPIHSWKIKANEKIRYGFSTDNRLVILFPWELDESESIQSVVSTPFRAARSAS